MTNKLSKCPRGAAILKNRKAAVGSWDLGTDLARLRKISDELTQGARSVQPKFPEVSVQNSMDRFRPTGKVSKKNGPIFPIGILVEWIVPKENQLFIATLFFTF